MTSGEPCLCAAGTVAQAWETREDQHLWIDSATSENCRIAARTRSRLPRKAIFQIARLHHIFAFKSHVGHSVGKCAQPHTIDLCKTHQDVEIMQPPGRIFSR